MRTDRLSPLLPCSRDVQNLSVVDVDGHFEVTKQYCDMLCKSLARLTMAIAVNATATLRSFEKKIG